MIGRAADTFNYLSKLSFQKISNYFLLIVSFYLSKVYGRPIWNKKTLPTAISIEPTTACNLRCPECPSGLRSFTRPTGMLDPNLFEKIISQLKHTLTYLTFYFQGEPFLHPSFLDLVKIASDARVYTATSTNGHFLNESVAKKVVESGLDRLIISLDGTSQETYEKYRIGGSLSKVMEGTKNVVKWKKKLGSSKPHIIFQFLIVRHNEHQIEEVKKLADTAGANEVKLKTAQIYDYKKGSPLMPSHEKYSRYKKNKDGSYSIKNTLGNSCWRMWHSCVITWDGKVVPCCFDKDAEFVLGEVEKEDFARLWKNDSYKNFRKTLLTSRSQIEMCKNCSEGSQVWQ